MNLRDGENLSLEQVATCLLQIAGKTRDKT